MINHDVVHLNLSNFHDVNHHNTWVCVVHLNNTVIFFYYNDLKEITKNYKKIFNNSRVFLKNLRVGNFDVAKKVVNMIVVKGNVMDVNDTNFVNVVNTVAVGNIEKILKNVLVEKLHLFLVGILVNKVQKNDVKDVEKVIVANFIYQN